MRNFLFIHKNSSITVTIKANDYEDAYTQLNELVRDGSHHIWDCEEEESENAALYEIKHIDGKLTLLDGDNEFIHFMRCIAVENDDQELSITCLDEAKDYLANYCSNLQLIFKQTI